MKKHIRNQIKVTIAQYEEMQSKKVDEFEYPNDHDEVVRALFKEMNFEETFIKEQEEENEEIKKLEQMFALYA